MATILVVDDSLMNRLFLVDLLGTAHHRVLEACDGAEALDVVRAERPDLVITDILAHNANELRRTNQRLTALVDLGLRLGSEHDLPRLLQNFCHAAREIMGARYAIAGIVNGDGATLRYSFTSGMDAATVARL